MSSTAKLLRMKAKLDETQTSLHQKEGSLETQMDRLKSEFGCASVAIGKRKLDKMETELDSLTEEFDKGVATLSKRMPECLD